MLSKSEDEEPITECKINGKVWNSRMDGQLEELRGIKIELCQPKEQK